MWVYQSFRELGELDNPPGDLFWEVGFFNPETRDWHGRRRFKKEFEAAAQVNYLNGGTGKAPLTAVDPDE